MAKENKLKLELKLTNQFAQALEVTIWLCETLKSIIPQRLCCSFFSSNLQFASSLDRIYKHLIIQYANTKI